MRLAAAFVALALSALAQDAPGDRSRSCETCHGSEARELGGSIHVRAELDCIACHGGVAGELDVNKAHGESLRSLRDPREAVESCGGCHSDVEEMRSFGLRTDQLSWYRTSRHGAKLAQDGDPNVATCVSCHGSHAVLSVKDPLSPAHPRRQVETCGRCHSDAALMGKYGLSSDAVESFEGSVHGLALLEHDHPAAPSCTDCHGSHGALPPRTADVRQVCGQCHAAEQEYYELGPHAAQKNGSAVQCTACHGTHSVAAASPAMFAGDDVGHCANCHSAEGDPALAVAGQLGDVLARLERTILDADERIAAAARHGQFLGDERGYLDEARGLLVRSRTMTHALSPAALEDVLNRGHAMVQTTLDGLATKQRIFRDRKIYTAIFFGVASAFAIALSMYGRTLVGPWKRPAARRKRGERGA